MNLLHHQKILQLFILVSLLIVGSQVVLAGGKFPANFSWGASTAAYQIEGAWNEGGRGLDWNSWLSLHDKTPINETGFIADDFYHRFQEDVDLMKKVGLKNFRMSISWTRVLPNGTLDYINQEGVDFYHKVFDALNAAGISPWVTLYHNDLPQALNYPNATGSWLNPNIPDIFNDFAEFCFKNFGDKVKNWITLNEPEITSWYGYGGGWALPIRCTPKYSQRCVDIGGGGNSDTEPYIVTKNLILSHAKAAQTYRNKYKASQGGQIGWTLNINYALPWNASEPNDVAAVDIYLQFAIGWYLGPTIYGEYPKIMQEYVSDGRLTPFTESEVELIKGSSDFVGINHYTTFYVQYTGEVGFDYGTDSRLVTNTSDVNGNPIGPVGESDWLYAYPQGIRGITNWISKNYGNPPIVVLENGFDVKGESSLPKLEALADTKRVSYINSYIDNLVAAVVEDGVNMIGYFVWSWMDNFEWGSYIPRFGLIYVDYDNNLTRTPKASAYFYIEKTKKITEWAQGEGEYPHFRAGKFDNHLIKY